MNHWNRYALSSPSRISAWGVFTCLSLLFCLLSLAIQVIFPMARIWHVAIAHAPEAAFAGQCQRDPAATLRLQATSRQGDEFDDAVYCLVCQAFAALQDIADIPVYAATDINQSIGQRPPTPLIVCQTFLYASASRAPPALS